MERRTFLKSATALAAAALAHPESVPAQSTSSTATKRPESPDMIYRQLGTTGERVSAIGLGGFHIGIQKDPKDSISLIRTAIDRGITFLDNCWDYNDGISEVRMGQALRDGYRSKVFLMTKIDGRTRSDYNLQLEQSLGRWLDADGEGVTAEMMTTELLEIRNASHGEFWSGARSETQPPPGARVSVVPRSSMILLDGNDDDEGGQGS